MICFLGFFGATQLTLTSCSKDKDIEDYKREKIEEENAKVQSAAGLYQGEFQHLGERDRGLGNIRIELIPDTKIILPPGSNKPEEQLVLKAKVTIGYLGKKYEMTFPEGFFDSVNKILRGSMSINSRIDNKPIQIDLSGILEGDSFKGKILASGQTSFGTLFKVVRNGSLPADQSDAENSETLNYSGRAQYSDGTEKTIDLSLFKNNQTDDEDVLDLLLPTKTWQANIKISSTLQLLFSNAQWDVLQNTLTGKTQVRRGLETYEFSLTCKLNSGQWSCQILSGRNGVIVSADFSPTSPGLTPPVPGTFIPGRSPQALPLFYTQISILGGNPRPVELGFSEPSLNLDQEFSEFVLGIRTLTATLKFSQTFTLVFPLAQMNPRAGTLTGITQWTKPQTSEKYEFTLDCNIRTTLQEGITCRLNLNQTVAFESVKFNPKPKPFPSGWPKVEDQNQTQGYEQYKGDAKMHNGRIEKSKMQIFFKRLSVEEEFSDLFLSRLNVDISITLSLQSSINISFPNTTWDKSAKTLSGEYKYSDAQGRIFDLKLKCIESRRISPTKRVWACEYYSNQIGLVATIDFIPE